MDRKYLLYTMKVWISGVLVAPAVISILYWIRGSDHSIAVTTIIPFYLLLVGIEVMLSFLTWLIFWALTMQIVFYINNKTLQRWLIFIIGIALTVITFAAYSYLMFSILFISLELILLHCLCVALGAWLFYPNDLNVVTKDSF